ncbi:hypothetical protein TeGR_g10563, partial [Tetraparma gracilis]
PSQPPPAPSSTPCVPPFPSHTHPSLGVLFCSYLDKSVSGAIAPHLTTKWKKRFVVLTHRALHWFKRDGGCDLLGEELGSVQLSAVTSVRCTACPNPADPGAASLHYWELEAREEGAIVDTIFRRVFRAGSAARRDEWVAAVQFCLDAARAEQPGGGLTLTGGAEGGAEDDEDSAFSAFAAGPSAGGLPPLQRLGAPGPWPLAARPRALVVAAAVATNPNGATNPVLATEDPSVAMLATSDTLPARLGHSSRPVVACIPAGGCLRLHLSTGQVVAVPEEELRGAAPGEPLEFRAGDRPPAVGELEDGPPPVEKLILRSERELPPPSPRSPAAHGGHTRLILDAGL